MRTHKGVTAVLAGVALLGLAACSSGPTTGGGPQEVGDWEPVYEDGVLQPLPDGFPSDPITLLNPDSPGHDDGLYARAIQSALEGISPVSIQVRDESYPTFGTWAGIQTLQSERGGPDGYYIMVAAMTGAGMDLLTEPITDEFGLTIDDLNPVIATERTPFVLLSRADAPWSSYEELVAAAKADPGGLRYMATVGSQLDIAMTRIMTEGGWTAERIPSGGSDEAATVVGAGEADFTMLTPSVAKGHVDAGRGDVLLVISGDEQAPDGYPLATTTAAIGLPDEPWGSVRGFVAAPGISELHRAWLFELIRAASEQDVYKDRIASLPGSLPITMDGDEAKEAITNAVAFAEPIIRELGLHYEQN
ncbi:MAG TPA: tripartite tricarboxylate transporter substrate-binding protein [Pseudolysinimonas sp.]|nr:tripartite tricarboxylate transporter substrate-binding protein [Pseudolysinimonas sp.]